MKKTAVLILSLIMLTCALSACSLFGGKQSSDQGSEPSGIENEADPNAKIIEQPEGNGIVFEEETDGLVVEKVSAEPEKYFGTWKATSDKAMYLYGNIDITVNKDGTWTANITDEDLKGTWEDEGDHLHMGGNFFEFDLAFNKDGTLFLIETGDDSNFNTVLTKQ